MARKKKRTGRDDGERRCSFCNKSQGDVRKLIAGPDANICDECVDICIDIIDEEQDLEDRELESSVLADCLVRPPGIAQVSTPPISPGAPDLTVDASTVAWASVPGTNVVYGEAFLMTRTGDAKTSAGQPIVLVPSTAEVAAYLTKLRNTPRAFCFPSGLRWIMHQLDQVPGRISEATDAFGYFRFEKVPDGSWHAVTFVHWEEPTRANPNEGGLMAFPFEVKGGETKRAIIVRAHILVAFGRTFLRRRVGSEA